MRLTLLGGISLVAGLRVCILGNEDISLLVLVEEMKEVCPEIVKRSMLDLLPEHTGVFSSELLEDWPNGGIVQEQRLVHRDLEREGVIAPFRALARGTRPAPGV